MLANELRIYKDCYQLVSELLAWKNNMPRMFRYDLGEKMINTALGLFDLIQYANMSIETRTKYLNQFIVKFELLKTILRLCFERQLFTLKQQAEICRLTSLIGKQAMAWKSGAEKSRRQERKSSVG